MFNPPIQNSGGVETIQPPPPPCLAPLRSTGNRSLFQIYAAVFTMWWEASPFLDLKNVYIRPYTCTAVIINFGGSSCACMGAAEIFVGVGVKPKKIPHTEKEVAERPPHDENGPPHKEKNVAEFKGPHMEKKLAKRTRTHAYSEKTFSHISEEGGGRAPSPAPPPPCWGPYGKVIDYVFFHCKC